MYTWLAAVLFVVVVSIDLFACGLAFGAGKVRVSFAKVALINIVGKVMVGTALVTGYYLGGLLAPDTLGIWLGFGILSTLGFVKIAQWFFSRKKAKIDDKQLVSWWEVFVLGVVLSFDGVAAAIGVGITDISVAFIFIVIGISIFSDQAVFMASQYIGSKITGRAGANLGWISGVILITVAVLKLCLELFVL